MSIISHNYKIYGMIHYTLLVTSFGLKGRTQPPTYSSLNSDVLSATGEIVNYEDMRRYAQY